METWEIVLILVLVTIALIVLSNHNVSIGFIHLLDNTLFQMALVGAALGISVLSPAVSIVSIATIVIVYYVRNLIKVQMINNSEQAPTRPVSNDNEPRLIVEETQTVETVTTKVVEIENKQKQHDDKHKQDETNLESVGADIHKVNLQTKKEDEDVIESALKEHENRVSVDSPSMIPTNFKVSSPAPVEDVKPLAQDTFPNPRSSGEGFQVDSTDPLAEVRGQAPHAGTPSYIPDGNNRFDDGANIFTPAESPPIAFNEAGAEPTYRPYVKSDGQYGIRELRPYSNVQKYETADYIPGNDMGSNDFSVFGVSIDDKIKNLQNGIVPSSAPPPNFDQAVPQPQNKPIR